MSRYMMIRRLRGPAFLLLVGALALLNQAEILSWGKSWPFFLILAGVLKLAERVALAGEGAGPAPIPVLLTPGSNASPAKDCSQRNRPRAYRSMQREPNGGQQ